MISHEFKDPSLLLTALTHRSFDRGNNYERLEFLGDAILGMVIAEALFVRYPHSAESDLTLARSALVRRSTLASIARELRLAEQIRLDSNEARNGAAQRDSVLADVLEAIIGAVYRDAGFATTRDLILQLFEQRLTIDPSEIVKDAKTRLQESLQAEGFDLPRYEVLSEQQEGARTEFVVRCEVSVKGARTHITSGKGRSRRSAEQQAAEQILALLASGESGEVGEAGEAGNQSQ